jgi:hypothetical protein
MALRQQCQIHIHIKTPVPPNVNGFFHFQRIFRNFAREKRRRMRSIRRYAQK